MPACKAKLVKNLSRSSPCAPQLPGSNSKVNSLMLLSPPKLQAGKPGVRRVGTCGSHWANCCPSSPGFCAHRRCARVQLHWCMARGLPVHSRHSVSSVPAPATERAPLRISRRSASHFSKQGFEPHRSDTVMAPLVTAVLPHLLGGQQRAS